MIAVNGFAETVYKTLQVGETIEVGVGNKPNGRVNYADISDPSDVSCLNMEDNGSEIRCYNGRILFIFFSNWFDKQKFI